MGRNPPMIAPPILGVILLVAAPARKVFPGASAAHTGATQQSTEARAARKQRKWVTGSEEGDGTVGLSLTERQDGATPEGVRRSAARDSRGTRPTREEQN